MDRKEFLLKSAGAAAAVSVSSLLKAGSLIVSEGENDFKYIYTTSEKREQELTITYTFFIPKTIDEALISEARMEMKQEAKDGLWSKESKYVISVKKLKEAKDGSHSVLKCGAYENSDGDDILSLSDLAILGQKKNCILYYPETDDAVSSIKLLDNKNKELAHILKHIPISGGGCFLTSACIQELGKDERCFELVELERFAKNHVSQSEKGAEMLKLYYGLAPLVVDQINQSPYRRTIWENMYDDLVMPTLYMIEEKKYAEAEAFYSSYSFAIYRSLV